LCSWWKHVHIKTIELSEITCGINGFTTRYRISPDTSFRLYDEGPEKAMYIGTCLRAIIITAIMKRKDPLMLAQPGEALVTSIRSEAGRIAANVRAVLFFNIITIAYQVQTYVTAPYFILQLYFDCIALAAS
jgi:hypothetical protein